MSDSPLEHAFLTVWKQLGYPDVWRREYRPFSTRRFRFDLAVGAPHYVAVEIDGGTWSGGRHVRGDGYDRDCEKQNLATAGGWRLFRVTASLLKTDPARHLGLIAAALDLTPNQEPQDA